MDENGKELGVAASSAAALPPYGLSPASGSAAKPAAANALEGHGPSDADWTAKELCKALAERDEGHFRTLAFWKRHTIIDALEAVSDARRLSAFLAEIHDRTPNGEWICVQHHPNGDWSVAEEPE